MTSPISSSTPRLRASQLGGFAAQALAAAGLPRADAQAVADAMLEADLTGADTHGIIRLPQYVKALLARNVNATPDIRTTQTGPATALVDGDNGMGHLVMSVAAKAAVRIARETGVAWIGVNHSNHAGAGGVYAAMPAASGMVGIYGAVSSVNHMAPSGGREPLLGTNPLAIAIPAFDDAPLLIDIAMSVVSWGMVRSHAIQGQAMPEGWMVDRESGQPLTDAAKANDGLMTAVGDYKGTGLSFAIGLLAGVLNGAAFGRDVSDFAKARSGADNAGQFIVALDVARFMPLPLFLAEVGRHVRELESSDRLPESQGIRLPGRERARRRADRMAHGILVPAAVLAQLDALASQLGTDGVASS